MWSQCSWVSASCLQMDGSSCPLRHWLRIFQSCHSGLVFLFFLFSFSKSLCFLLAPCPLPGQGFWLPENYRWPSLPVPPLLAFFPRTGSGLPDRSLSASGFPFATFSLLKAHVWTLCQHSISASSRKQGAVVPRRE